MAHEDSIPTQVAPLRPGGPPRWVSDDWIDFGELPSSVNALLQRGVLEYRSSAARAEEWFRVALELAPAALPVYFCLYKIHTYQSNLDAALDAAHRGLAEASRQAGWPSDFAQWRRGAHEVEGAARFALYTLKALAFIRLKRGEAALAAQALDKLSELDPEGLVGWRVVADLLAGVR
jgi:tetratricopeptide (TPR) repeat protein